VVLGSHISLEKRLNGSFSGYQDMAMKNRKGRGCPNRVHKVGKLPKTWLIAVKGDGARPE